MKIIRSVTIIALIVIMILSVSVFITGCSDNPVHIKALIVAKFETGEMSGDDIGEAQLIYEKHMQNSTVYELKNANKLYYNPETEIALGVSGVGKAKASSYYATVLTDNRFDFSDAHFLNIGCCGAAKDNSILEDVVLAYETVDYDLGYELSVGGNTEVQSTVWIYKTTYDDFSHYALNRELTEKIYSIIKDIPLKNSEDAQTIMNDAFPDKEWANRSNKVLKGTTVTSDSYWKGISAHNRAIKICSCYDTEYPYCSTEMEDNACASTLNDFGFLEKMINIRACVNMDIFISSNDIDDYASGEMTSIDMPRSVFRTGMENLESVCTAIIDAISSGTLR